MGQNLKWPMMHNSAKKLFHFWESPEIMVVGLHELSDHAVYYQLPRWREEELICYCTTNHRCNKHGELSAAISKVSYPLQ